MILSEMKPLEEILELLKNEQNVAIIGCGRIADLHELGYCDREDAKIVAVCDTSKRRARNKAREWGVNTVYTDYEDVLADPEIHLVELLVPHHLHAAMTIAAVRFQPVRCRAPSSAWSTFASASEAPPSVWWSVISSGPLLCST